MREKEVSWALNNPEKINCDNGDLKRKRSYSKKISQDLSAKISNILENDDSALTSVKKIRDNLFGPNIENGVSIAETTFINHIKYDIGFSYKSFGLRQCPAADESIMA